MKHNKSFVRFLSILMSVTMLVGLLPITVFADPDEGEGSQAVSYILRDRYGSEEQRECSNPIYLSEDKPQVLTEGWYFLDADVTYTEPILVQGEVGYGKSVNLILGDGKTLTAKEGIIVESGNFNVYTQSDDSGKIDAASSSKAGIFEDYEYDEAQSCAKSTFNWYGGNLEARGAENCAGIGGSSGTGVGEMNFYGGYIEAYGGISGAGIGSGKEGTVYGSVYFYYCQVLAIGGTNGAGIGGGLNSIIVSAINFEGADVIKAEGKGKAPGIGAYSSFNFIEFNNESSVNAVGGSEGGAGIGLAGGSEAGTGGFTILLGNANVLAQGGSGAAGVGGGYGVSFTGSIISGAFFTEGHLFTIAASAGQYNGAYGQAFGDGAGVSQSGSSSIQIKDQMTVLDENGNQVLMDERLSTCRGKKATLTTCTHPDLYAPEKYENKGSYHDFTYYCEFCALYANHDTYSQNHYYDHETHECVCGSREYEVSVIGLEPLSWQMPASYSYAPGDAYTELRVWVDNSLRAIDIVRAEYIDPADHQKKTIDWSINELSSYSDSCSNRNIDIDFYMPGADVTFEIYWVMNVSFGANGGTGSMSSFTWHRGTKYTLPACSYNAPEGKTFAGWTVNDSPNTYAEGVDVLIDSDTVILPQWIDVNAVCSHEHVNGVSTGTGHVLICEDCGCQVSSEQPHVDAEGGSGQHYWDDTCDICGEDICHVFFVISGEGNSDETIYKDVVVPIGGKVNPPEDPVVEGKQFFGWVKLVGTDKVFFDFDTVITQNIALNAEFDIEAAIMKSATVIFEDELQIEFTMELTDAFLADSAVSVIFEKDGNEIVASEVAGNTGNVRKYRVSVPILDLEKDITIRLENSGSGDIYLMRADGKTQYENKEFVYSVKQYIKNTIAYGSGASDQMKRLAYNLFMYFEYARAFFQEFPIGEIEVNDEFNSFVITEQMRETYGPKKTVTEAPGVIGTSLNVLFDANNALRLTFTFDEGYSAADYEFAYYAGGVKYVVNDPIDRGSNKWAILIEDIDAPNLGYTYTFTLTHKGTGKVYSVDASAYSYCLLAAENGSSTMQGLAKALYCYGEAAYDYFQSIQSGNN